MREFSPFEQEVIRKKLMDGSGLSTLFSDDIQKNGRWLVTWSPDAPPRFKFFSDKLEAASAFRELVDTIELLRYLETEKLIRKYHPPDTLDHPKKNNQHTVSLGLSESKTSVEFKIGVGEYEKYARFIIENENHTFVALEPLRVHVNQNFITAEEKRARRANLASLIVAAVTLIGVIVAAYQNHQSRQELLFHIGRTEREVELSKGQRLTDSLQLELVRTELARIQSKLDSITSALDQNGATKQKK